MATIEDALGALRQAKEAAIAVDKEFTARRAKFVENAKAFLTLSNRGLIKIGDTTQGVEIPLSGKITWYGIMNSAILSGYEKQLLDIIQKETSRVITSTEAFR